MSFEEQVKALAPISLEAPSCLRGVIEDTSKGLETSREASGELLNQFESTNAKVEAVAEDIRDLQSDLAAAVEEIMTALDRARENGRSILSESTDDLNSLRDEVQSVVSNFQDAMKTIEMERESCASAQARLESAISNWASQGNEAQLKVTSEFDNSIQRLIQFDQQAGELRNQCQGSIETLMEQIAENGKSIQEGQSEIKQACETRFSELDSTLQGLVDTVITTGANELISTTRGNVEDSLKQVLDTAIGDLRSQVDEIIETITGADEDTSQLREELEPVIEELEDVIEPLKQCIKRVHDFVDNIM